MILNDGTDYHAGQGREMAQSLRGWPLDPAALEFNIEDARGSIRLYGRVPGATMDLFVADLILRGIVTNGVVALALLGQAI